MKLFVYIAVTDDAEERWHRIGFFVAAQDDKEPCDELVYKIIIVFIFHAPNNNQYDISTK